MTRARVAFWAIAGLLAFDLWQLFGTYRCPACRARARHGRQHVCIWTEAAK